MKNLFILCFFILSSCQLSDSDKKAFDGTELEDLYAKIRALSESKSCENSNEWKITAIGSKACGGPTGYIAYSNRIDETEFLALVKQYTTLQEEYNIQNNIYSDCMYVVSPSEVVCENGKPVFLYDS